MGVGYWYHVFYVTNGAGANEEDECYVTRGQGFGFEYITSGRVIAGLYEWVGIGCAGNFDLGGGERTDYFPKVAGAGNSHSNL